MRDDITLIMILDYSTRGGSYVDRQLREDTIDNTKVILGREIVGLLFGR